MVCAQRLAASDIGKLYGLFGALWGMCLGAQRLAASDIGKLKKGGDIQ